IVDNELRLEDVEVIDLILLLALGSYRSVRSKMAQLISRLRARPVTKRDSEIANFVAWSPKGRSRGEDMSCETHSTLGLQGTGVRPQRCYPMVRVHRNTT
ncbi:hypothetical protein KC867_03790, partial [Candidatus Saccharibacteria bacterium]|nr:hypothetical protein [Candidatus Saccharibacteria bacterium]